VTYFITRVLKKKTHLGLTHFSLLTLTD